MTFEFDPKANIIEIKAGFSTGDTIRTLRLALDTGATRTVINAPSLKGILDFSQRVSGGYALETANGDVVAFGLRLPALFALNTMREEFEIIVHDIGSSIPIDGVLGLDFLRDKDLRINFRRGEIELS